MECNVIKGLCKIPFLGTEKIVSFLHKPLLSRSSRFLLALVRCCEEGDLRYRPFVVDLIENRCGTYHSASRLPLSNVYWLDDNNFVACDVRHQNVYKLDHENMTTTMVFTRTYENEFLRAAGPPVMVHSKLGEFILLSVEDMGDVPMTILIWPADPRSDRAASQLCISRTAEFQDLEDFTIKIMDETIIFVPIAYVSEEMRNVTFTIKLSDVVGEQDSVVAPGGPRLVRGIYLGLPRMRANRRVDVENSSTEFFYVSNSRQLSYTVADFNRSDLRPKRRMVQLPELPPLSMPFKSFLLLHPHGLLVMAIHPFSNDVYMKSIHEPTFMPSLLSITLLNVLTNNELKQYALELGIKLQLM